MEYWLIPGWNQREVWDGVALPTIVGIMNKSGSLITTDTVTVSNVPLNSINYKQVNVIVSWYEQEGEMSNTQKQSQSINLTTYIAP